MALTPAMGWLRVALSRVERVVVIDNGGSGETYPARGLALALSHASLTKHEDVVSGFAVQRAGLVQLGCWCASRG